MQEFPHHKRTGAVCGSSFTIPWGSLSRLPQAKK